MGSGGVYVSRPPSLGILYSNTNAVVSWPSPAWGFKLQQNSNLVTTNWSDIAGVVIDDLLTRHVVINAPSNHLFFRLRQE
ncbi:hypothetical protein SBV1_410086 [Verrucomicrobia bacterium]|nr:hypothetical protein SBV1_410086 [Verrucomicrobiota bacterium]